MKLTSRSPLTTVALAAGDAMRRRGVRAVLTGGSAASVHSGGDYLSKDIDFVIQGAARQDQIDAALQPLGFRRAGDRYVHPSLVFYVEFPPGPLAVGGDDGVKPVVVRDGRARTLALSPTDSCRDRLAAFYHWDDRQSLRAAVLIADRHRVNLRLIERWSRGEGAAEKFADFERRLRRLRSEHRRSRR